MTPFDILEGPYSLDTISTGHGIRELQRLNRTYGRISWRKRKGLAKIRLPDGDIKLAELHWYEGRGIGRI